MFCVSVNCLMSPFASIVADTWAKPPSTRLTPNAASSVSRCFMPLLNGMKHLDTLDAAFGVNRVLGGLAQVSATIDANGDIKQFTETQNIFFGVRHESQRAAAE